MHIFVLHPKPRSPSYEVLGGPNSRINSIIHELHQREFAALRQPTDEMAVNDTVDVVGFDFIRWPQLDYVVEADKRKGELLSEGVIRIKTFKSEAVVRDFTKKANRERL